MHVSIPTGLAKAIRANQPRLAEAQHTAHVSIYHHRRRKRRMPSAGSAAIHPKRPGADRAGGTAAMAAVAQAGGTPEEPAAGPAPWQPVAAALEASIMLALEAPAEQLARQPWAGQLAVAMGAIGMPLDLRQPVAIGRQSLQGCGLEHHQQQLDEAATREGASKPLRGERAGELPRGGVLWQSSALVCGAGAQSEGGPGTAAHRLALGRRGDWESFLEQRARPVAHFADACQQQQEQ